MDTKILAGIIGVIWLLVGWGGTVVLSQDQITNSYVCSNNGNVGIFDRLSSTAKSGYYKDESGTELQKICRDGYWKPLEQYAKESGIELNKLEPVTVVQEVLVKAECPNVRVVAYVNNCATGKLDKFYCTEPGQNQVCESSNIELPLYRTRWEKMKDGMGGGSEFDGVQETIDLNTVLTGNTKLYFRDTGIYIQSDADGKLKISADGTDQVIKFDLSNTKSPDDGVVVLDSDTFPVSKLDAAGNIRAKANLIKTLTD